MAFTLVASVLPLLAWHAHRVPPRPAVARRAPQPQLAGPWRHQRNSATPAGGGHVVMDYEDFLVEAAPAAEWMMCALRAAVAEAGVREVHHKLVVLGERGESPPGFTAAVLVDVRLALAPSVHPPPPTIHPHACTVQESHFTHTGEPCDGPLLLDPGLACRRCLHMRRFGPSVRMHVHVCA